MASSARTSITNPLILANNANSSAHISRRLGRMSGSIMMLMDMGSVLAEQEERLVAAVRAALREA
jgi:hypothetical protein